MFVTARKPVKIGKLSIATGSKQQQNASNGTKADNSLEPATSEEKKVAKERAEGKEDFILLWKKPSMFASSE
jgi:hypothetical protein